MPKFLPCQMEVINTQRISRYPPGEILFGYHCFNDEVDHYISEIYDEDQVDTFKICAMHGMAIMHCCLTKCKRYQQYLAEQQSLDDTPDSNK